MKILTTTNAPFDFAPPADVVVVPIDERNQVPDEHLDADAAVLVGWRSPAADQLAAAASRLRWVQTLAAGPDGVLAAGFPPGVAITTGRGLHTQTVAEAAVALALTGILRFPGMLAAQREHRWAASEFGNWHELHPPGRLGSLIDTNVLIWGFGAIGQHAATIFRALSAHVRGIARSAGDRAGFEVFTEDALPQLLPQTDVLVMVLPHDTTTERALDAARLALLPTHAWLVNVGRGTTVDEDALVAALQAGRLGGAALDVTAVEPYPADGPLWDCPNTIVVPHVAGGVAHGADALFGENLRRLCAGEPLRNLVDR